jgi:hypothetical protein
MRVAIVSRRIVIAGATLVAVIGVSTAAFAQSAPRFTPGEIATNSCWIDAATGKRVPTGPPGWSPSGAETYGGRGSNPDPNHVELSGKTFVKVSDGNWIDAATGNPVPTGPPGWSPSGAETYGGRGSNPDPNHVELGHKTFVRVPCPPPPGASSAPVLPVLPFSFGFGLGLGHRDHGDDRFQK